MTLLVKAGCILSEHRKMNLNGEKIMSQPNNNKNNFNFIDLFAGAGGLSEGFIQAGFNPIAHVEMNESAAQTLVTRSAYYYLKQINDTKQYYEYLSGKIDRKSLLAIIPKRITQTVICETMSDKTLPGIFKTIDGIMKIRNIKSIDLVIGGPPCQAYSLVGRAQSSRMEVPMSLDPRNELYKLYARFLTRYKPKMFVFENVMGIESANDGNTWKNIKKYLRRVGYEIECREQNAKHFGVLQNRRRMIIVGWLKESGLSYPDFPKHESFSKVSELFNDLPKLTPGKGSTAYSSQKPSSYVRENEIRTARDVLTLHHSRPNKERDIEIYKKAIMLWNDGHKRLNYNDLPEELKTHKNRSSFIDRFKVVEGDETCCHTVLAHLSKDGHYFIHPDLEQHRSITVREAARIQSFPDSYFFEGPRTAQFVQVGNAVPPMMAKGIATGIAQRLEQER